MSTVMNKIEITFTTNVNYVSATLPQGKTDLQNGLRIRTTTTVNYFPALNTFSLTVLDYENYSIYDTPDITECDAAKLFQIHTIWSFPIDMYLFKVIQKELKEIKSFCNGFIKELEY